VATPLTAAVIVVTKRLYVEDVPDATAGYM
jgi:hypothetical protein